jgi:hypothetical protein
MNSDQDSIRQLAHRLWEQRGRPEGDPDEDWFAAEWLLGVGKQPHSTTAGDQRGEKDLDSDAQILDKPGQTEAGSVDSSRPTAGSRKRRNRKPATSPSSVVLDESKPEG